MNIVKQFGSFVIPIVMQIMAVPALFKLCYLPILLRTTIGLFLVTQAYVSLYNEVTLQTIMKRVVSFLGNHLNF